jgi:ubiquinone/menaquinone biosynthesis C-methylase UbiE
MMAGQQNSDNYNDEVKYSYNKMWSVFDERRAEEFAAHLVPHLKRHHRILDIGCGRGSITIDLAGLVPDGSVLGIDIQPTLIDIATARATQRNISNIEFKVMDANVLESLPSESFDVIHAHQVLFHLSRPNSSMPRAVSSAESRWYTVSA